MSLDKIANKIVETDVLVVGGGIAGLPCAHKLAERGLNVVMAEKAKSDRSGSAGQGIDHYSGFMPEGMTPTQFKEIWDKMGPGAFFGGADFSPPTRLYRTMLGRKWASDELEKMGVPMKWDDGEYRVIDIKYHGGWKSLRVHWMNVKPIMAKACRKIGVNMMERTMITDLLTDGKRVVGATALNTRTGEFIVIKAKATVMATGAFARLYNPETAQPWKYKFRYHWFPASVSGDSWAMAYRAGAELGNMEQAERGYRFRDDLALSYGNVRGDGLESRRLCWDGTETRRAGSVELAREGMDPFYYSLEHLPEDYHKRIEVAYVDERLLSFKVAEERGFNPKTHRYEMMEHRPNQLNCPPGIVTDDNWKTNLEGLYAIGDTVAGNHNVAACAVTALLVGEHLPNVIGSIPDPKVDEAQVEAQKEVDMLPLKVKDGTEPMELECAIRYAVERYVGSFRSQGKLQEGLRRLSSLRKRFLDELQASNPHFQMRAIEIRNILDLTRLHMKACLERKETRGQFVRLDYPEKDPQYDNLVMNMCLKDGEDIIEWKKLPELDMNYKEERK